MIGYRILVIDTLNALYGGVRFFERQDPWGNVHIIPPI
jgi:hypothetical protein